MPWIQLQLHTTREHASDSEDALLAAGAAAVTLEDSADQPVFEPGVNEHPLWDLVNVTGLFEADTAMPAVLAALELILGELPSHRVEILEDKDWEREWMSRYQPLACGERLWICPSWCEPEQPEAINLMLDPGLAFGTGTHPTTFLCLQWLDRQELTGKTVIDYGCGSGILGIAALLLGAERVIAVDNDPQALTATTDNAQRNGIAAERLHCCLPEDLPADSRADVVVANILAAPLLELAPQLAALLPAGGLIALSGILDSQGEAICERYSQWFDQLQRHSRDEWLRISGVKQSTTPAQ